MNRVPVAKTKSAPKTVTIAAGKPKALYGTTGSTRVKRTFEALVRSVPIAVDIQHALGINGSVGGEMMESRGRTDEVDEGDVRDNEGDDHVAGHARH